MGAIQLDPNFPKRGDCVNKVEDPELNKIKIKVSSGVPEQKSAACPIWHACHRLATLH